MTRPYENPYIVADEESALLRHEIAEKLESWLIRSRRPSCCSIVGERGTGTVAGVRHFLKERAPDLKLHVVICDIKTDLRPQRGARSAGDFYCDLVKHISRTLTHIPEAHIATAHLAARASHELDEIEEDLFEFFRAIRENGLQLLIVFFNFDVLPLRYSFEDLDWTFLRELHNQIDVRVVYLLVSRRAVGYIEQAHGLERSLFGNLFLNFYRVGPLTDAELQELLHVAAQAVPDDPPFAEWLWDLVTEWGGRHLQCTEYLCYELFERLYNQGHIIELHELDVLKRELRAGLTVVFDSLYQGLTRNDLAGTLSKATIMGIAASDTLEERAQMRELSDLGYLIDDPQHPHQKTIFSPLFRDYLAELRVIETPNSSLPVQSPRRPTPAVQAILDLKTPTPEIRAWYAQELHASRRLVPKETDQYVLLYLTGCARKLSHTDLKLLRYWLTERYRHDCEGRRDPRKLDAIRSTFHSECKRWRARYDEFKESE